MTGARIRKAPAAFLQAFVLQIDVPVESSAVTRDWRQLERGGLNSVVLTPLHREKC